MFIDYAILNPILRLSSKWISIDNLPLFTISYFRIWSGGSQSRYTNYESTLRMSYGVGLLTSETTHIENWLMSSFLLSSIAATRYFYIWMGGLRYMVSQGTKSMTYRFLPCLPRLQPIRCR